jgi:predicted dehydrogenase
MLENNSRRDFIKKTSLAVGSFYIVPRHVLGGKGFTAPSDKLNIMGIGCGGKGLSDVLYAYKDGAENVTALVDVDDRRAAELYQKFPKVPKYRDFRVALEKEKNNIDAVTVSTPDHTHATIAMAAMQMGKHVYVQKPLTHNIYEARMLTEAARKYKVVTQMGNQGGSGDGVRQMMEWFDAGLIGTVNTAYVWTNRPVWPQGIAYPTAKAETPAELDWDLWLGPAPWREFNPAFVPFKWRGWWDYGTGALGDMACHLIDPVYRILGLGSPTEVECSVGSVFLKDWTPEYIPEGCPPSSTVQLQFGASKRNNSAVKLTWMDGGIRPMHPEGIDANEMLGDPDGANGAMLIGTKGIMTCGTYSYHPKVFINGKRVPESELPKGNIPRVIDAQGGHNYQWVQACKAGLKSKEYKELSSPFDYAGPFTESILMGNLAIRSYMTKSEGEGRTMKFDGRKKLLWDGANMRITNYDLANQYVKREYRAGWKL